MRATLHIGTHKTETTSIQEACLAAREELLAQGILYPNAGRKQDRVGRARHVVLSHARDGSPRQARALQRLFREIDATGAQHLVLSTEGWCSPKRHAQLVRVVQDLRRAGFEVEAVVFLRNRHRYARSHFREWTQNWRNARPMGRYVQDNQDAWDYLRLCKRLGHVFEGRVHYASFEDTPDSVSAFCKIAGLPALTFTGRSNPSLDAVEAEIYRQLNAAGRPLPDDLDALFAGADFWKERVRYSERTDWPELAAPRAWCRALERHTGLTADQVAALAAPHPEPERDVAQLSEDIAKILGTTRAFAA